MDHDKLQLDYLNFPTRVKTLVLSTVNDQASPHASYAPFVVDENRHFYIYVSQLSAHTTHLLASKSAAIMLIEDEAQTVQMFARKRLTYECTCQRVSRNTKQWKSLITQFEEKFGNIMLTLRSLTDFEMIKLVPHSGRYVAGFGAAHEVDSNDLFTINASPSRN